MNVVLYLRYSSDKQTEQSIEGQRRVCQAFCKANDYTIVGEYVDEAKTASKDVEKRENFQRLMRDSAQHKFEAVIVYKLDRFSRDRYVSVTYKGRLKRNGVKVVSATENISDNPEGILLESVLEGLAEFYSVELSQKVKRGMNESALKCNSCGGHISIGYKIVNKKYVIDTATAPIVREAFNMYANGATISEICRDFRAKGYLTAKGKPFNQNSFHKMFNNVRYIGEYRYADVVIPDGMPRIIDDKTWEAVQKRMAENKKAPARGKAKVNYLLSGKLFCGHCGSNMVGDCGTSKTGEKHYYYSCGGKKNAHNRCDKKSVRKEHIERLVAEDALNMLSDEMIDYIADLAVKENQKDIQNNSAANALRGKLKDIDTRLSNLMKSLEMGVTATEVTDRINELSAQKRDYEKQLSVAEAEVIVITKQDVVLWLNRFKNGDINDEHYVSALIDMLVNHVTIYDDPEGYKITICYNLTENRERTITAKESSDIIALGSPKETKSNTYIIGALLFVTRKCGR